MSSCAKYLGFMIGPGAGNQDWDRVLGKVGQLSKFIRELGLLKFFSFSLFQMFLCVFCKLPRNIVLLGLQLILR